MIRRVLTIVFAVLLACGWAGAAWGEAGGKADPTDDVFDGDAQKFGEGHLDIVKVSHADDGKTLTYTVRTAHQWATTDLTHVVLGIERLDGLPQYDCQQVSVFVVQKSGKLDGYIHQCLGSGGGMEGGPGGSKRLGTVTASHVDDTDTIRFSFALAALRAAGFEGGSYNYNVLIEEAATKRTDHVPGGASHGSMEWITHTFSAPATPVPTAAPTVAPTPSPEPTVAPAPSPESTVEPTSTPQPDAMSFAAPEERAEDDATSAPLRVAAVGSVVAAAGIALVRFWPF